MEQIKIEDFESLLVEKIEELVNVKLEQKLKSLGISVGAEFIGKEWMNLQESAAYVGVCVNTLKEYEKRGLRVFRKGGKVIIGRKAIDNFLIKHSR